MEKSEEKTNSTKSHEDLRICVQSTCIPVLFVASSAIVLPSLTLTDPPVSLLWPGAGGQPGRERRQQLRVPESERLEYEWLKRWLCRKQQNKSEFPAESGKSLGLEVTQLWFIHILMHLTEACLIHRKP